MNSIMTKLMNFSSLDSEDQEFIKMNFPQLLKDCKMQEITIYRGGAFSSSLDNVPKYMRNPSISVIVTDQPGFLTFENEYANVDAYLIDSTHELNESYTWLKHLMNLSVDTDEHFSRYCVEMDNYVNKILNEKPAVNKQLLASVVGRIDEFKINAWKNLSTLEEKAILDKPTFYAMDILSVIARLLKNILTENPLLDNPREYAEMMWTISKSSLPVVRYNTLLSFIDGYDIYSDEQQKLKKIDDLKSIGKAFESAEDIKDSISETIATMSLLGYGSDVYKNFNEILPTISAKSNWKISIPFDMLAAIYKSKKIKDIVRVQCPKTHEFAVICKNSDDDIPYVLYMDIEKPIEDDNYIIHGVQLTHDENVNRLRIGIGSGDRYDFVFDDLTTDD